MPDLTLLSPELNKKKATCRAIIVKITATGGPKRALKVLQKGIAAHHKESEAA